MVLVNFAASGAPRTNQIMMCAAFFLLLPVSVGARILADGAPGVPELLLHGVAVAAGATGSWLLCEDAFPIRSNNL